MFPSKIKSRGRLTKSFVKDSPKGSMRDDNKSDMTNNEKLKSMKHPKFDTQKFYKERYTLVKDGLECVLHCNDIDKYDDAFLKKHVSDVRYLATPGKSMENLKFELNLRSYNNKKILDDKNNNKDDKKDLESLMSKSNK